MEKIFATPFENGRDDKYLIFLSVMDPPSIKRSKFTDHEIIITKNLASESLHRQRRLKENVAVHLLE